MDSEKVYIMGEILNGNNEPAITHKERVRRQRIEQLRNDNAAELQRMYDRQKQLKREISSGLHTPEDKRFAQAELSIINTRIGILTARVGDKQTMFDASPDIFP